MRSLASARQRRLLSGINVVPYVDVMLVLLVILMISAPLVAPGQIQIDLPSASVGQLTSAPLSPLPLEVVMRGNGSLVLQERGQAEQSNLSLSGLELRIKEYQRKQPNRPVIISADRQVRYDVVLDVLDRLRSQGINQVGLSVRPAVPK